MVERAVLEVINSDDPRRVPSRSVIAAVVEGSAKDLLVAMRARLAVTFDDEETPARDLAAISRRMLELDDRIRAIELAEEETEREQDAEVADEEWTGV